MGVVAAAAMDVLSQRSEVGKNSVATQHWSAPWALRGVVIGSWRVSGCAP